MLHLHHFLSLLHVGIGKVGVQMVSRPLSPLLFLTSHRTFYQLRWLLSWLLFPLILSLLEGSLIVIVCLLLLHL
jgi:hypothetical protein